MENKYDILERYVLDQNNWERNLEMAEWYISQSQWSAAFLHYMKCAELVDESQVQVKYHCLMMIAHIYRTTGDRWLGVEQYLRFAKAEMPHRPEAYWMLADVLADKLYRNGVYEQGDWIQVYENAAIGLTLATESDETSIYYPGMEYLKAIYSISLLRLNKIEELKNYLARTKFTKIDDPYVMNTIYFIYNELRVTNPYTTYTKERSEDLKLPFNGCDSIDRSYSQVMQDMFVLTALRGKRKGTYLEIGSADPTFGSNTKLLELMDWTGISIDYSTPFANQFNESRVNKCLNLDAVWTDYRALLNKHYSYVQDSWQGKMVIDYLSLDIDPARNTLEVLYKLPLNEVIFNTITFEHDAYQAGDEIRTAQRQYLEKHGYRLVGRSIKHNLQESFEDWWIHESVITRDSEWCKRLFEMFSESRGLIHKIFYK